jgi:hypothetical protein
VATAARSPKLRTAMADASRAGYAYVVLDGPLLPIDRVAADWPFYSGKRRRHGMNLRVITGPDGDIVWVSGPLPGSVRLGLVTSVHGNYLDELLATIARLDAGLIRVNAPTTRIDF